MNALEAYDILLRRQMNEDRILGERTSLFLLATSFLFLAFVTLLNPDWTGTIFKVLRILVPIVGIFLTCVLYGMNRAAVNSSDFWHNAQRKIEEEAPEFNYMREKEIAPHIQGTAFTYGNKLWGEKEHKVIQNTHWWRKPRFFANASCFWLPLAFGGLWVAALVLVIAS